MVMNSPFILTRTTDKYSVSWPTFHDIRGNPACYNLLKLLFETMQMNEVVLMLNNDQKVTLNGTVWYSNNGDKYAEWLMAQYNITGVIFKEKAKAEYLQDYLEKKYIWQLLKT